MYQVEDEPVETIHLYVVREGQLRPSLIPVLMSILALSLVIAVGVLVPPPAAGTARLPPCSGCPPALDRFHHYRCGHADWGTDLPRYQSHRSVDHHERLDSRTTCTRRHDGDGKQWSCCGHDRKRGCASRQRHNLRDRLHHRAGSHAGREGQHARLCSPGGVWSLVVSEERTRFYRRARRLSHPYHDATG